MALYDYLGNPVISDVETDTTLTRENIPADAKAVGDELSDLQDKFDSIINADNGRY